MLAKLLGCPTIYHNIFFNKFQRLTTKQPYKMRPGITANEGKMRATLGQNEGNAPSSEECWPSFWIDSLQSRESQWEASHRSDIWSESESHVALVPRSQHLCSSSSPPPMLSTNHAPWRINRSATWCRFGLPRIWLYSALESTKNPPWTYLNVSIIWRRVNMIILLVFPLTT